MIELFRRIGVQHWRGVEIGCGANGGNADVLVAGLGFGALLLDGDEAMLAFARRLFAGYPAHVRQAWITRETVNDLLAEHGFDRDLDYLGIDLDGVDYWIWAALAVRPRVMLVEYNQFLGPTHAVTIPYAADFAQSVRDDKGGYLRPKGYFGASLAAFEALGRRKRYRLVATVPLSPNAIFVRDDVDGGLPAVPASQAWRHRTKKNDPAPHRQQLYDTIHRESVMAYFETRGFPLVDVR